jgi:serine/threonine protein phosphatase PrpC
MTDGRIRPAREDSPSPVQAEDPTLSDWMICGASEIGPAHRRRELPNQDSWLRFRNRVGMGVVVCDGVGSAPNADFGSRAACWAVSRALAEWWRYPDPTDENLIRLIHLFWTMRIHPNKPRECATTCLFAAMRGDSAMIVGQLGDGGILLGNGGGDVSILAPEKEGFANQTTGLGMAVEFRHWTIRRMPPSETDFVVLATDGVFDDLLLDELPDFFAYLRRHILAYPQRERMRRLHHILRNWPTPKHSDDKTIAVLWRDHPRASIWEEKNGSTDRH